MADFVTPAIPAGQLVTVTPSVLSAGGDALDLIGIILTDSWRVPLGSVYQFPDAASVGTFFGLQSQESGLASVYFNGFNNSNKKPGLLNFSQYARVAVGAWLRGASLAGMTLTALQALSGVFAVTIDAVLQSQTVNLSAATSFSNAGQLIQNALAITGPAAASVTGSVGATFTGTGSGTNLTTSAVVGVIHPGTLASAAITGTGVPALTYIVSQTSGTPGGAGVYVTSGATTAAGAAITCTSNVLDVTVVGSGALAVGDKITGTGIAANTYIAGLGTGTGGAGTYTLTASMQAASTTITATAPAVWYDSVSGGFVVNSGTTGATSTITYGSGVLALALKMDLASGATISQGHVAYTPAAAMTAVVAVTQDWVSFMTTWEPSDADKEAFASWTSGQNGGTANRYVYEMWETSALDIAQGGPSAAAAFVTAGNLGGSEMIYADPNVTTLAGEKAAFAMGATASVDYSETNGYVTFAFKGQAGLLPDVIDGAIANILAGSPGGSTFGFGINFYGDYTTANQAFIEWQRGLISGPFRWKDDYVNQIWFNNQLVLALMVLMQSAKSLPYSARGYALVEAALLDPIAQALNFGMIIAGKTLSASQIAQINGGAGNSGAAQAVQNQGFYLQIKPASPQVRASRGSPPCTLWYSTPESIQHIDLASIEVS